MVVVVVVVVVLAPKWNEQRKNEPRCARDAGKGGARGAGEFNRWVPLTSSLSGGPAEDGGSMICK